MELALLVAGTYIHPCPPRRPGCDSLRPCKHLYRAEVGYNEVIDSCLHFLQASHVGKVVIACPPAGLAPTPSGRATVAITGGSGGLGVLMAGWMAATGEVSAVHLISRTGRLPAQAAPLTAAGIAVTVGVRKSLNSGLQPT